MSYPRRSSAHDSLATLEPHWGERFGMTVGLRFSTPEEEHIRLSELALGDLSALPRFGCKGREASEWIAAQNLPVPSSIYGWRRLEDGGLLVRVDSREFMVENGFAGGCAENLIVELGSGADGVYQVQRQDAAFVLAGTRATDVLAQTCGIDFARTGDDFLKTRVALTSCSVKREPLGDVPAYRVWCEPSYGEYLFAALLEIVHELGGGPVGWECVEGAVNHAPE
jgi:sarcosine oxidase subunit gamma